MNVKRSDSAIIDGQAAVARRESNPPAFPQSGNHPAAAMLHSWPQGMSLRDYFAAAALPALVAHYLPQDTSAEDIADACYVLADALLDERQKEHDE